MSQNQHISILMPVYNARAYLNQCIDSIRKQDHTDWELIAVNDFSTDDSLEILRSFSDIDKRIRVYQNSSKGIIPALALAFSKSSGPFITRMDADDIMPSDKLSSLSNLLKEKGTGHIITGKVSYFSDQKLGDGYLKYQNWLNQMCENGDHFAHIYKECVIPSACWIAYKSDLLAINAFVESQYPEDYDLVFKFYINDYQIQAIKKVLHLWRDHPERASRNDPNYKDQHFFQLKLQYFLRKDRKPSTPLFLWGAGRKGKLLAKLLIENKTSFFWVTNNANKIGHFIYEQEILPLEILGSKAPKQVIVSIADTKFQSEKDQLYKNLNISKHQCFEF